MASNFELNLPDQTTPTKILINADSILLSPSSVRSAGDETSAMINTGGVPIAMLKTPTKGMAPQNIAPKQPIAVSPSKLYIKQSVGGTAQTKVSSSATQLFGETNGAPVYKSNNGKVQYLRLVSSQNTDVGHANPPTRQIITTQVRSTPATVTNSNLQRQHILSQQLHHQQKQQATPTLTPQTLANRHVVTGNTGQRVLLPAGTPQTIRISGSQSLAQIKSQLPPGTTILSSSDSSGQMLAFLPSNHSVIQRQTPVIKPVYPGAAQTLIRTQDLKQEPMPPTPSNNIPPASTSQNSATPAADANKLKKPCNCTKSQCLKLYCDCFANGEFCANCNCQNCYNNLDHEEERQKAVKQCLERNPQAFHPKIGKGAKADARRHQKGCNCKRSGCLKNYCECYEAKIPCGSMCKCVGCKNCEQAADGKSLMHLADAADLRQSQLSSYNYRAPYDINSPTPDTQSPHVYLKTDVIEAVMSCLIAQCREAETAKCNDSTTEKVLLEEYGRCLSELIKASSHGRRP